MSDFVRSSKIGLGASHDDECQEGGTVEEPGREAEEVDQAADVPRNDHADRQHSLRKEPTR